MSALFDRRANVVFDALFLAGDAGLGTRDLHLEMARAGVIDPDLDMQVVQTTVNYVRRMFSVDVPGAGEEVITCVKRAHGSRYYLATTAEIALEYRQRRCQEISTQIRTIERQVATERDRFGGQHVFTQAALDYIGMAVRELERGATMQIVP